MTFDRVGELDSGKPTELPIINRTRECKNLKTTWRPLARISRYALAFCASAGPLRTSMIYSMIATSGDWAQGLWALH